MAKAATGAARDTRRSLADVAKDMHPIFAGESAGGDAQGKLTDKTIQALWDGGFFGMWIPREFGGVEAAPIEALGTVEELSYSDGSTGWVFMALEVAMGSAAAYLPAGTAKELFGKGRWPLIAGQGAPLTNKGVAAPGGYQLTGKWSYGSGLLHSSWIHTGASIFDGATQRIRPDNKLPEVRIFILPVEQST